jgi:hypothetical protein
MLRYPIAGGGPETITILNVRQGRYRYRISEDGGVEDNVERINKSEAQVSVYTSTDVKEFKVGKAGSGFVRVRVYLSLVLSLPLRLFSPWHSVLRALYVNLVGFDLYVNLVGFDKGQYEGMNSFSREIIGTQTLNPIP